MSSMSHMTVEYKDVHSPGHRPHKDMSQGEFVCQCGQKEPFCLAGMSMAFAPDAMAALSKVFIRKHGKCKPGEPVVTTGDRGMQDFRLSVEVPRK